MLRVCVIREHPALQNINFYTFLYIVGHDFFLSWIRIQPNLINYAVPDPKPWKASSILCCNLVIEGLKFMERNAVMLMLRSHYTDCTHTFKQNLLTFLCVLFFSLKYCCFFLSHFWNTEREIRLKIKQMCIFLFYYFLLFLSLRIREVLAISHDMIFLFVKSTY
jgi:hypothetical protein